jgi:quercetin dioxygenase-like cupin family protein
MFCPKNPDSFIDVVPGIQRKTLVHGPKTLMSQFRLSQGASLPDHAHPYEQTGMLISGRIRLFIDQECFEVQPGDSWCIPGDVSHRAEILEASVAVEVFSPAREDYLPAS